MLGEGRAYGSVATYRTDDISGLAEAGPERTLGPHGADDPCQLSAVIVQVVRD